MVDIDTNTGEYSFEYKDKKFVVTAEVMEDFVFLDGITPDNVTNDDIINGLIKAADCLSAGAKI